MEKPPSFPLGLTYDDVLLLPDYADFSRSDIDLTTQLTRKISLQIPLIASPMDTVCESELAIVLAELGGIGIIHRNLTVKDQADEVAKVHKRKLLVGAAIGASKGYEERVEALVKAGVDIVVIDTADGYKKYYLDTLSTVKNRYPKLQVMAGNIATYDAARALIERGADALRVGMGPGAICTTRIVTGMGVPQITAIMETAKAAKRKKVPVIADGGAKYSGDMVKALAVGASAVMMGSYFASAEEAPGKVVEIDRDHVPSRFKSILTDEKKYKFKEYRGMGSIGAMKKGAEVKSEEEYHGKSYKDRVLVAEGVEGLVPVKGSVKDIVDQALGGIRSGMYHVGARTIIELQRKARFIQITQASLTESHPHDILITNPGENY